MGIANDLKVNGGNLERDLRVSGNELKNDVLAVKDDAGETAKHFLREEARTVREQALDGLEYGKEALESAGDRLREAGRRVHWKTVAGAVAGLVVLVGVIALARRRARRDNLLERGFHEGARYAGMVPREWHKARKAAVRLARESARESARLWDRRSMRP